jgi:hypothetical protein
MLDHRRLLRLAMPTLLIARFPETAAERHSLASRASNTSTLQLKVGGWQGHYAPAEGDR